MPTPVGRETRMRVHECFALRMTLVLLALLSAIAAPAPAATLTGSIRSADGKPLEGVTVSAKRDGTTITTTVFTDEQGMYVFPALSPTFSEGTYNVWAQAIGYGTARAGVTLEKSKPATQDFTMKPLGDFSRQLSSAEWMAALPDTTPADARMKMVFRNNCAGCHQPSFVLQNKFDEAGWRKIIDVMERVGIYGDPPDPAEPPMPLVNYFKEELAAYLAKVAGPNSNLPLKPSARPRGEAAQVVITEYDITSNSDLKKYVTSDGSDWMEGTPSAYEARGPHDAEVDQNGIVWIADSQANPERTIARLDPATGAVKHFKLDAGGGMGKRSHGIVIDQKGIAWFNADGVLGKIDTRTEKLEQFAPPKGMARVGGTLDVDNNGIVWMSTNEGALAFDPATDQFKQFKSLSPGQAGRTYGVAADADGNGWWAQMNYDKLGVGNYRTGEITEVALARRAEFDKLTTDKDREAFKKFGSDWNSATFDAQAPRRLGADKKGSTVWVANWWGDNLAKIDSKTHKVTLYTPPSPNEFRGVYDTVIDKHGMVWMNLMNADRVARFDPQSEKWTEFHLPTRGTETRFIAVDNRTEPVEVWTPYWRTSKLARIQFRTTEQIKAQQ
jgi:streptogramin lyase